MVPWGALDGGHQHQVGVELLGGGVVGGAWHSRTEKPCAQRSLRNRVLWIKITLPQPASPVNIPGRAVGRGCPGVIKNTQKGRGKFWEFQNKNQKICGFGLTFCLERHIMTVDSITHRNEELHESKRQQKEVNLNVVQPTCSRHPNHSARPGLCRPRGRGFPTCAQCARPSPTGPRPTDVPPAPRRR